VQRAQRAERFRGVVDNAARRLLGVVGAAEGLGDMA
jgi:hypothetical protein